jgi:hypothetical protein
MTAPAAAGAKTTARPTTQFGTIGHQAERADPCTMVIFGATGDLTKRKLFPALYSLAAEHLLAPRFAVLAVGRE